MLGTPNVGSGIEGIDDPGIDEPGMVDDGMAEPIEGDVKDPGGLEDAPGGGL